MKKKIIGLGLATIIITIGASGKKVKAFDYYSYDVGKTINLVTSSISDSAINDNNYIFDLDKLYSNHAVIDKKISNENIEKKDSFSMECNDFTKQYSVNCGIDGNYSDYSMKIGLNSKMDYSTKLVSNTYHKFYSYLYSETLETQSLNDTIELYSMYSNSFISRVNSAFASDKYEDYKKIFDDYGTHFIIKAVYGNCIERNAWIMSNDFLLTEISDVSIMTAIKTNNSKEEINFDISTLVDINNIKYESSSYYKENHGLISSPNSKYVAIWEYFKTEIQEKMEYYFKKYSLEEAQKQNVFIGQSVSEFHEDYYKIDDGGVDSNPSCPIKLEHKYLDYSKKVVVSLNFRARQKDKGYSFIYFYDGNSITRNKTKNELYKSDDLGLSKSSNYKAFTYECCFSSKDFTDYLWIMFDASGTGPDEWRILDLNIKFEYII